MRRNGRTPAVAAAVVLAAVSGCRTSGPRRSTTEPALSASVEPGGTVVDGRPAAGSAAVAGSTSVTWVDRHPLFSKPRDYYDTTQSSKVGKVAAATVIGIPAGFLGEMRQIIVGRDTPTKY